MGTNCAPLVADLFLFCYERDFMMSLSDDKQADVIDAFNTTSRYLDDIYTRFFVRKIGYINFVPKSVCRPSVCLSVHLSVCPSVCPSVTFLVIISPPKPLDVATSNIVDA